MIIFPAIDIKDGMCVRLRKGDFSTVHKVADDPVETALNFQNDGAAWLHVVDLDGALQGKRVNANVFLEIVKNTGLLMELGGGIRSMDTIEYYLAGGIKRLILGSAALNDAMFCREAVKNFPENIAIGIDAKEGYAVASGWIDHSEIHYLDLAKRMEDIGVKNIIFTDVSKDGMLSGPNVMQLEQLSKKVSCDITASGGVSSLDDIRALAQMGLYGAICGKAVYTGDLSLKEAIIYCKEKE